MTKAYRDCARLIWVDSFLKFAAYDNAERAEKATDANAEGILRHIRLLETWLGKALVTDSNPNTLLDDGFDFLDVALEIDKLVDDGEHRNYLSRIRVARDGFAIKDSDVLRDEYAVTIAQRLWEELQKPGLIRIEKYKHVDYEGRHKRLRLRLQQFRMNLDLVKMSPATKKRQQCIVHAESVIGLLQESITALEYEFGPFERVSGASIDMDAFEASRRANLSGVSAKNGIFDK